MGRPKTFSPKKAVSGKVGKEIKVVLPRLTHVVGGLKVLCPKFRLPASIRRSQRPSSSLKAIPAAAFSSKKRPSVSLGEVPDAVLWSLFKHCEVKELSQMGRSSRRLYQWLRKFVCSADGAEHFVQVIASASAQSEAFFADFAGLLRMCTIGKGHEYRINLAVRLYAKLQGRAVSEDDWGLFISKFCRGWDEAQRFAFMQRFVQVQLVSDVGKVLDGLASGKDDDRNKVEELRVRRLVHSLFSYEGQGIGKILEFTASAVMRLLCPPERRHLLLMLLYAPIIRAGTNNSEQVRIPSADDPEVQHFDEIYEMFGVMSMACQQLLQKHHSQMPELRWTDKEVFEIIEDLTTYPEPWTVENFSAFLVFRPLVAFVAVGLRVVNGWMQDAGSIVFNLIELSSKMGPMCHLSLKEMMSDLAQVLPRRLLADLHAVVVSHSSAGVANAWTVNQATARFDREALMQELRISANIASLFGHAVTCLCPRANH